MEDSKNGSPESPPSKKMKNTELISVIPILHDSILSTEIPLKPIYTAQIRSKKDASTILKLLPPLPPDLEHLKRIRKNCEELEIVIGNDKSICDQDEVHPFLNQSSICQTQVPARKPMTSLQFKKSNDCWPCNFHPDKETEKLVSTNGGFDAAELEVISENMEIVLDRFDKQQVQSCAFYDPNDTEIVSVANSSSSILDHSAMNCLKILAETQKFSDKEVILSKRWEFGEVLCRKRVVRNKHEDYLCTGLDVYLSHEPCIMCAMALLHSRAKRIFYVYDSAKNGGVNSVVKLHCLDGINHRFQVFKVVQ